MKKEKNNLFILLGFMKNNFSNYLFAITATIIFAALNLITPYILGGTIDSIIGGKDYSSTFAKTIFDFIGEKENLTRNLYIVGIFLILVNIITGFFSFIKVTFSNRSSENIAKKLRDRVFEHLQKLPYSYHSSADKGDLMQRCTSDIETIRSFLSIQLIDISGSLFSIVFVFTAMSMLNAKLTMISGIFIPFIFIFSFIFFKKIKRVFKTVEEAEGKMSNVIQENVNGVRVVKAFGQEHTEMEKFDVRNIEFYKRSIKLTRTFSYFWSIADFTSLLQVGVLLLIGAIFAVEGKISIGTLIIFVSYEWMILWPVKQLGRILGELGKTMVSVERIKEIFTEKLEQDVDGSTFPEINGDIKFSNVSFWYKEASPILRNISFEIKRGQTLGIIGPTGSGKSTLIHLLQRLFDYDSGSILISGVELKTISRKWIRQNIGLVLQEPFLYSKTIGVNIALAHTDADLEMIQSAAKTASLHEVIIEFDKGYETLVGEKGVTLSGGQKQRLAIARTIIKEKPVLIFDDSLSAVDTETDMIIRHELKKNAKEALKIIISHRVNTLKDADLIIVIEEGEITQKGTHDELIEQEGLYKRISMIQDSLSNDFLEGGK